MKIKVQTKKVAFDAIEEGEVMIKKLNLKTVRKLQDLGKEMEDAESFEQNLEAIKLVLRAGVKGFKDLEDETFEEFALADLAFLQQEVMAFSGLAAVSADEPVEEGND